MNRPHTRLFRFFITFLMGISSGLPLMIVGSTLQAWMKDEKVDLTVIGLFSLVGLPYTLKFLWAPLMDRFVPPFLGRRRGWMFIAQFCLIFSILTLGFSNPSANPLLVALIALLVSFFSASQDIVLDAFRREFLPDNELGFGTGLFINGYRVGMLMTGALALVLADRMPWPTVFIVMASFMIIGLITTLLTYEPEIAVDPPRTLREAVIEPFREYFSRKGALWLLAFILLYKLGDNLALNMTVPFYLDLGFTKTEYGAIGKTFGLFAILAGALVGGGIMIRLGINRSLWVFGFLQMIALLGFSALAVIGKNLAALSMVIVLENFAIGMGTAAFTAFLAKLTNIRFTATQFALLSSMMGVPRVILAAPTGWIAKELGWFHFFIFCSLMAIPGLLLLTKFAPWRAGDSQTFEPSLPI